MTRRALRREHARAGRRKSESMRQEAPSMVSAPRSTEESIPTSSWERWKQTLLDFWTKCNNDWIFNFSGLLAYALLMSIFPLFLVVLAIAGLSLDRLSPDALTALANHLAAALPGKTGSEIIKAVLDN